MYSGRTWRPEHFAESECRENGSVIQRWFLWDRKERRKEELRKGTREETDTFSGWDHSEDGSWSERRCSLPCLWEKTSWKLLESTTAWEGTLDWLGWCLLLPVGALPALLWLEEVMSSRKHTAALSCNTGNFLYQYLQQKIKIKHPGFINSSFVGGLISKASH